MAATPAPTRALKGTATPTAAEELPEEPLPLAEAPGAEAGVEKRSLLALTLPANRKTRTPWTTASPKCERRTQI